MTSNKTTENEEFDGVLGADGAASVEDFIKELEAKEKDLHISSEMVIEVAEADFDDKNIPDFVSSNPAIAVPRPAFLVNADPPQLPADQTPQLREMVRNLKGQVSSLTSECADLRKKSHKQLLEIDNVKTRSERERSETFSNQLVNLATRMLPVLDNLNRALDFALAMPAEKREEILQFFDGIVLVNQQVNEVFAGMGVQPIPAVGEDFDPHLHEAVAMEENGDFRPNTISAELLRGYRIGSRVIRHSMVKVVTSPKPSTPGPEQEAESQSSESDAEAE